MQTYPVFFHDWHGQAYRDGGRWLLVPKHLSDHLGLGWSAQLQKIRNSNLSKGMSLIDIPSARGTQETVTLKMAHFGAWVLSIRDGNVPPHKRELLLAMQDSLLDALERQLGQMFGLPLMEAEDFLRLPVPCWSGMGADACLAARTKALADPPAFTAARLMRVGLPASRVAPLVNRSVYWARQQQRHFRAIGVVPPTPAQQRLLEQPSLFGEG